MHAASNARMLSPTAGGDGDKSARAVESGDDRQGEWRRLLTGPGVELKTRRPEPEREHGGELGVSGEIGDRLPGKSENFFLWRFGVAYNVTLGERYAIAPALDLDFVREDGHWVEALVFTVSIGFDF